LGYEDSCSGKGETMIDRRHHHGPLAAGLLLCSLAWSLQASLVAAADASLRQAIFAAEHNRAGTEAELSVLTGALTHKDPDVQCLAVRALGRLERPELAERIRPLMAAAAPAVRSEAATAFGRALNADRQQASAAGAYLRARLEVERDPEVRAAICEALGRLSYQTPEDVRAAAVSLVSASRTTGPVLTGAARGLESLIRLRLKTLPPEADTVSRLHQMSLPPADVVVRRLALAAVAAAGKTEAPFLSQVYQDRDDQMRRLAVKAAASLPAGDATAEDLVRQALKDDSPMVRFDALATHSRRQRQQACESLLAALGDPVVYVSLQATDLLPGVCRPDQASALLQQAAGKLTEARAGWHGPAHALAALARLSPESARPLLARFAAHPQWQVRAYAARAAASAGETVMLEKLARDADANVRTAAVSGLSGLRRHEADPVYLEALAARDYQLISTAARALAGAPDKPKAVAALLAALKRVTGERRDTSRDPRSAILQRLRELGSAEQASALAPYLEDFDSRIAALAAEVLTAWTGTPHNPKTRTMEPAPAPKLADIEALASATANVTMQGGGSFELRLLPAVAPDTVWRFVELARAGYYNGLTFHRVEPNFVIQGGSPGANEYMGDARYMRDELGRLTHARGTLGISTRGRDTGDAQIFINLVDNPRLDADYTVFAEVVRGMEVVDGLLEGAVIERISIRPAK
jgi:cyclophilin family peptidyl-prolyl cis-trans isomerase/HEAT repeat protein